MVTHPVGWGQAEDARILDKTQLGLFVHVKSWSVELCVPHYKHWFIK